MEDRSREHRSRSGRTQLTLPPASVSQDGHQISWFGIERIVANNGWRLNDVSRQMAIDMFPNMFMHRVYAYRPVRAAERVDPRDFQPGEELEPDNVNVYDDIEVDWESHHA